MKSAKKVRSNRSVEDITTRLSICLTLAFSAVLQAQNLPNFHSPSEGQFHLDQRPAAMRILYIAAHPDDENTRLIAHWSQFNGYEVAYLSLTEGEGGQNILGPELGEALGVIRREELYAARRLDGATQYFGGAADFGYSKTVDETLEKWNENEVLARIETVVLEFKPDVIVTRFPPDARAGHGHHTASAVLAIRAFERLQSMGRRGGYAPKALYWNTSSWWAKDLENAVSSDSLAVLQIGGFIPELGQSSLEIGTLARGMHKSQGFAGITDRGERTEYLQLLKGEPIDWTPPSYAACSAPMPIPGLYAEWTADSPYLVDSVQGRVTVINESAEAIQVRRKVAQQQAAQTPPYTVVPPGKTYSFPANLYASGQQGGMVLEVTNADGLWPQTVVLSPEYVTSDRIKGELRRPVQVTPRYSISYDVPCLVVGGTATLNVHLHRYGALPEESVQLDFQGDGVIVAEHSPVRFPAGQSVMHTSIAVRKPTRAKAGQTRGTLTAYLHGDEVPLMTAIPIRYDHIPHQEVWVDGSLPIVTADIAVPKGLQVGYIDGAGDDAPEALKQLGVTVKRLNAATLTEADLQGLTSVVLGIRAFNVNQGLAAAQPVLENWVQNGGHLIIQYNTATRDQVTDHMGPVPFKLGRDRVTVEETPATFLAPEHLMMTYPNALSEADFDGWVQERGLYFASEWDQSFVPLVEWADPGETPKQGAWITAPSGKGQVTYCGLSLFREWRAGVPGAYRILANLVAYPTSEYAK
jgi:LmbE family N-acetylglucosaminyl deacetylase